MHIVQQFLPYLDAVDLISPLECEQPQCTFFSVQAQNEHFPREFVKLGWHDPFNDAFDCGYQQFANNLLKTAIKAGHVKAYGRETDEVNENPLYTLIPSAFLEQADIDDDNMSERTYRSVVFYSGEKSYYDVHVCRTDVETFFDWWFKHNDSTQPNDVPPSEGTAQVKVDNTIKAEKECSLWLAELVKQKCCKTRREIWLEASRKFEGTLSQRGFGRVWDAVAPREWKASGRRHKKS